MSVTRGLRRPDRGAGRSAAVARRGHHDRGRRRTSPAWEGPELGLVTIGAVAAHFGRDVDRGVSKVVGIIDAAARDGVELLVFPDACLGGYLGDLRAPDPNDRPPALDPDGPEIAAVIAAAGPMTVCVGYAEAGAGRPLQRGDLRLPATACSATTARCISPRASRWPTLPVTRFAAFDTPVGRLGMLIDYDKTFPESARALALDGAQVIAALSAWPASVTDRASRLPADRQSRLFDLYDCARAAENQVVVVVVQSDRRDGRAALPRPGQGGRARRRRPGQHGVQGRPGEGDRRRRRRDRPRPKGVEPPRRTSRRRLRHRRPGADGARRIAHVFDETPRRRGAHARISPRRWPRRASTSRSGRWPGSGDRGFFRAVDPAVRVRLVDFPDCAQESVTDRIVRSIATLRSAFTARRYDVVHAQDCISANAVGPVHPDHPPPRRVHHAGAGRVSREGSRRAVRPHLRFGRGGRGGAGGLGLVRRPSFPTASRRNGSSRRRPMPRRAARRRVAPSARPIRARGRRHRAAQGHRSTWSRRIALLRRTLPDIGLVIAGGETLFDYRDYRADVRAPVRRTRRRAGRSSAPSRTRSCPVWSPHRRRSPFPSTKEGFGLAAMEALAAGRPVVTRDLPVLREVFGDTVRYASTPDGVRRRADRSASRWAAIPDRVAHWRRR